MQKVQLLRMLSSQLSKLLKVKQHRLKQLPQKKHQKKKRKFKLRRRLLLLQRKSQRQSNQLRRPLLRKLRAIKPQLRPKLKLLVKSKSKLRPRLLRLKQLLQRKVLKLQFQIPQMLTKQQRLQLPLRPCIQLRSHGRR